MICVFGLVWCFSGARTHQALGATAVDITQAPPPKIGFESNRRGPSSRLDSLHIVTSPCTHIANDLSCSAVVVQEMAADGRSVLDVLWAAK